MNPKSIIASGLAIRSKLGRWADLTWYGLVALSVGIALGSALILEHFDFRGAAVSFLALACVLTSWYGERGPALLAVVLSTLGFNYFHIEVFHCCRSESFGQRRHIFSSS